MKHKILPSILALLTFLIGLVPPVAAIENPLAVPNNKIGMHILFDHELEDTAKLVNSNGGEWGYVLIPIQSGDKDLVKWQAFMDRARAQKVIPIIRLATEGDYFNTHVWRTPKHEDVVDFANFLDSLEWPTKNRYVIIFNEVNRGDEWGGSADPAAYADILSYAVTVFKSRDPNFFVISSGMDNAAPNEGTKYMNQYTYLRAMNDAVPGIFNQVDGISSHSYPNPAFAQPPSVQTPMSIASFRHERALVESMSNKKLPVFITETGWSSERVSDDTKVLYYQQAFASTWNDEGIVTVIPFLLKAGGGPFTQFSFLGPNNEETKQYQFFKDMQKVKGTPVLAERVLSSKTTIAAPSPQKNFTGQPTKTKSPISRTEALTGALAWIFKL